MRSHGVAVPSDAYDTIRYGYETDTDTDTENETDNENDHENEKGFLTPHTPLGGGALTHKKRTEGNGLCVGEGGGALFGLAAP